MTSQTSLHNPYQQCRKQLRRDRCSPQKRNNDMTLPPGRLANEPENRRYRQTLECEVARYLALLHFSTRGFLKLPSIR